MKLYCSSELIRFINDEVLKTNQQIRTKLNAEFKNVFPILCNYQPTQTSDIVIQTGKQEAKWKLKSFKHDLCGHNGRCSKDRADSPNHHKLITNLL